MKLRRKKVLGVDGKVWYEYYHKDKVVAEYDGEYTLDVFRNWLTHANPTVVDNRIREEYDEDKLAKDLCVKNGIKYDRRYTMYQYGGLKLFLDKKCTDFIVFERHYLEDNVELIKDKIEQWNKHIGDIHKKEKNIRLLAKKI